jgi:biotin transport system substrate-specific component
MEIPMKEQVQETVSAGEKTAASGSQHRKIVAMVQIALFAAIIAICSWIQIPLTVPFTLQTFAVFCTLGILGGKNGTISVLLYIILGAVGVPVFAGFSGGVGVLLGTTGGYIIGFLFTALLYWVITHFFGDKLPVMIIAMALGLVVCYAFGTAWFMLVYARTTGAVGLMTALGWCVFPFILPDCVKIALAILLAKRIPKHLVRSNG